MKNLLKPLKMLLHLITPSCEIISETISESMDSKISMYKKLQIRLHLWSCKFCTRYRKQLNALQSLVGENATHFENSPKSPSLSDEARQRMKQKLSGKNDK